MLGDLDRYMQKKETRPPTYTIHQKRWIKDLNISHDTIKVLEEKRRQENFRYPTQQYFHQYVSRARDIRERINKWDSIELKKLLHG